MAIPFSDFSCKYLQIIAKLFPFQLQERHLDKNHSPIILPLQLAYFCPILDFCQLFQWLVQIREYWPLCLSRPSLALILIFNALFHFRRFFSSPINPVYQCDKWGKSLINSTVHISAFLGCHQCCIFHIMWIFVANVRTPTSALQNFFVANFHNVEALYNLL